MEAKFAIAQNIWDKIKIFLLCETAITQIFAEKIQSYTEERVNRKYPIFCLIFLHLQTTYHFQNNL
jgi:hypothetical protein